MKYTYTGPTVQYIDGPYKGQRFESGRRYERFPAELAARMQAPAASAMIEHIPDTTTIQEDLSDEID
jgi:hypothetical protein